MPVQFNQTLSVKTIEGDHVNILNEEISQVVRVKTVGGAFAFVDKKEPIVSSTDVTLTCDNPKCPVPQKLEWNQEAAAENSELLPDGMWRTIGIKLFTGEELTFCGARCAMTYLSKHTPLRSPREQRLTGKVVSISDGTGYNGGGDE